MKYKQCYHSLELTEYELSLIQLAVIHYIVSPERMYHDNETDMEQLYYELKKINQT